MTRYAVAALILMGTAAGAQEQAPAVAEKKICRAMTPTGTIMSTSVCRTRHEWASMDSRHDEEVAKARRNNTVEYSQGRGNLINQ